MIDYRLAYDALNRKPDYSFGNRVVEGMKVIDDSVDRQRLLEQRALQDQQRQKMQTFGDFLGQEYEEDPILSRLAGVDPMKALGLSEQRKADQNKFAFDKQKAEDAANAKLQKTNLLNDVNMNKFNAVKALNKLENAKTPEEKAEATAAYNEARTKWATKYAAPVQGMENNSNIIKGGEVLDMGAANAARAKRKLDLAKSAQDIKTNKLNFSQKKIDHKNKYINDFKNYMQREGLSRGKTTANKEALKKLYAMVSKSLDENGNVKKDANGNYIPINVGAIHAINILSNKSLDPNSAVLLSEADAWTPNSLTDTAKKSMSFLQGRDPRSLNVKNTFNTALGVSQLKEERYKTARDSAVELLNSQISGYSDDPKDKVTASDFDFWADQEKSEKEKEKAFKEFDKLSPNK